MVVARASASAARDERGALRKRLRRSETRASLRAARAEAALGEQRATEAGVRAPSDARHEALRWLGVARELAFERAQRLLVGRRDVEHCAPLQRSRGDALVGVPEAEDARGDREKERAHAFVLEARAEVLAGERGEHRSETGPEEWRCEVIAAEQGQASRRVSNARHG
jgi:hypothetical protein